MKNLSNLGELAHIIMFIALAVCMAGCVWAVIGPMQGKPFTFGHFLMTTNAFVIWLIALIILVNEATKIKD